MSQPLQILGHRGARGLFPENTLEGIQSALALGLRRFEIDVGVLKDGEVVVHHDLALNPDLARTPSDAWLPGPGPLLRHMTWDELQDYDVGRIRPGTPYAACFAAQAPHDGARIPRLADMLRLDPSAQWLIELKLQPDRPDWSASPEAMADAVLAAVDAAGAASRATLQSFDWRAPRHVRRVRPEIATAWLTAPETAADPQTWWNLPNPPSPPDAVAAEGGQVWAPSWEALTPELVRRAQRLGLQVMPWTVNETDDMARLIEWGADGLITDYPDRAMALVPAGPQ